MHNDVQDVARHIIMLWRSDCGVLQQFLSRCSVRCSLSILSAVQELPLLCDTECFTKAVGSQRHEQLLSTDARGSQHCRCQLQILLFFFSWLFSFFFGFLPAAVGFRFGLFFRGLLGSGVVF